MYDKDLFKTELTKRLQAHLNWIEEVSDPFQTVKVKENTFKLERLFGFVTNIIREMEEDPKHIEELFRNLPEPQQQTLLRRLNKPKESKQ